VYGKRELAEHTPFGGQSESLGKTTVNRIAPQRHPPAMLSGRAPGAIEVSLKVLDVLWLSPAVLRVGSGGKSGSRRSFIRPMRRTSGNHWKGVPSTTRRYVITRLHIDVVRLWLGYTIADVLETTNQTAMFLKTPEDPNPCWGYIFRKYSWESARET
jgi:hypothetical protein